MPYSYMTCVFPERVKKDARWKEFIEFRKRLFKSSDVVEAAVGGDHWFYAISTKSNSLQPFARLAMQVYSYCHITAGRSRTFRPKLCLFQGKGAWDPGAVFDALEDAAYDMMRLMPDGWMSCHHSHLNDVLAAEPALKKTSTLKQEQVTNLIGEAVAVDCWGLLAKPNTQAAVLLGSSLVENFRGPTTCHLVDLITKIHQHPNLLSAIPPRKLEVIVAELLLGLGYQVQLTAPTRDRGRDILLFAVSDESCPLPEQKYLVEVKHPYPGNLVGVGTVRSLVGVGATDPNTGLILVTTTRFTRDARRYAERGPQISLGVERLSRSHGLD